MSGHEREAVSPAERVDAMSGLTQALRAADVKELA